MYILKLNEFIATDKVEFIEIGEGIDLRKAKLPINTNVNVLASNTSSNINDYQYLLNTLHYEWDDQRMFETTKITIENKNIVTYRKTVIYMTHLSN